jgi:hypothetical protein
LNAKWGAAQNTQQHQKTTTTAAATPRTTAPPTPSNQAPPHDKGSQLVAQVKAVIKEGEEARGKMKELEKQLQQQAAQLDTLTTTMSQLALEVQTQQRSNSAWQDSMTRQIKDMMQLLHALRVISPGQPQPTPATLSPRTDPKKRGWDDTQLPPGTGADKSQLGSNRYAALASGDADADDMETVDDGNSASGNERLPLRNGQPSAEQKGGDPDQDRATNGRVMGALTLARIGTISDQPPLPLQQGHAHGAPHPQPQSEAEGGGH